MIQHSYLECPTMRARKARVDQFMKFVEANRKTMNSRQLIARFALDFGLQRRIAEEYLRLLVDSGIYRERRGKILTQEEFDKEGKKEEERMKAKQARANQLGQGEYSL